MGHPLNMRDIDWTSIENAVQFCTKQDTWSPSVESIWSFWLMHRGGITRISPVMRNRISSLTCMLQHRCHCTSGLHFWQTMTWYIFRFLPQVKNVFDQEGFSRQKRGYRNINDIEVNMSDPLFTKQWYLVSNQPSGCLPTAWPLAPTAHSSTLMNHKPGIFPTTFWINVVIHSLISLSVTSAAFMLPSFLPSCLP